MTIFSMPVKHCVCGAVDYLLKPLDKDQLQKRIEQVVVENLHGTVQLEVRKNEDPILRRPYEEFSPLIVRSL